MNSTAKTILFWVALLLTAVLLYQVVQRTTSGQDEDFNFTRFMQEVERGTIREVTIADTASRARSASDSATWRLLPVSVAKKMDQVEVAAAGAD